MSEPNMRKRTSQRVRMRVGAKVGVRIRLRGGVRCAALCAKVWCMCVCVCLPTRTRECALDARGRRALPKSARSVSVSTHGVTFSLGIVMRCGLGPFTVRSCTAFQEKYVTTTFNSRVRVPRGKSPIMGLLSSMRETAKSMPITFG